MLHLFPHTHTYMNRQSQQLVVAGVVAFLTSGIITLAGLSAAQDMNMGGTPPPGDNMGGMQQPMMNQQSPMEQQPMGGPQPFRPINDYRLIDQGTPSTFQGAQEHDIGGVRDFQMDGPNFHPGAGNERGEGGIRNFAPGKNVEKAGGGLRTFDPRKGNFGDEGGAFGRMGKEEMGRKEEMMGKMQRMEGDFGGRFGDMSGKDHGAATMPKMPKIQLPSLGSLDELAAEEEEVTFPQKALATVVKLAKSTANDCKKAAKAWGKLGPKLDDGVSKKEQKSLVALGTKVEGIVQRVDYVLEQVAAYVGELDPEKNPEFFTAYETLETTAEQCGAIVEDAASYFEE